MTVSDLISILQLHDPASPVMLIARSHEWIDFTHAIDVVPADIREVILLPVGSRDSVFYPEAGPQLYKILRDGGTGPQGLLIGYSSATPSVVDDAMHEVTTGFDSFDASKKSTNDKKTN